LRILIKDLFAQQRAVLRRDLLDSHATIASRVADEIRPNKDESDDKQETGTNEKGPLRAFQVTISILAVTTIVFAWLYWQREQAWQELQVQHASLQRTVEEQRVSGAESTQLARRQIDAYQQSTSVMFAATVAGLQWGANQGSLYEFHEFPLGDARLIVVEQLAEQLDTIDFSGLVRIETHVADFCLTATGTEGYELAPGELPAILCDRTGLAPGEAYELGLRQSVAFANFVRLADVRSAGRIRYEISSLGNTDPVLGYPTSAQNVSAGTWNEIAARNNRVEIFVLPDPY
jgi:hypothetical protein